MKLISSLYWSAFWQMNYAELAIDSMGILSPAEWLFSATGKKKAHVELF